MKSNQLWAALALAMFLSACGGGGGGGEVHSLPPPPTASPTPTPTPPPGPFGISADTQFAAEGVAGFRWNETDRAYEINLEGNGWERLTRNGGTNGEEHYPSSGMYGVHIGSDPDFTYTKFGRVFENGWGSTINFLVFGLPTRADEVPVTGTASYDAKIVGEATSPTGYYDVAGTAELTFDFGAGSLQGHMQPILVGGSAGTLPRYDFSTTVYSRGSTSFSGSFATSGLTGSSSFSGSFTGPAAAELLAKWQAPFLDLWSGASAIEGSMKGVWVGRKRQ